MNTPTQNRLGTETAAPLSAEDLLDQAAYFNAYAVTTGYGPLRSPAGPGIIGLEASATLHRFAIELDLPSSSAGVRATNTVGEVVGRIEMRWLFVPHDFPARPDRRPPPTLLDSGRSQRFVMQTMIFRFGGSRNGFSAFGTGRTLPMSTENHPELGAAAVGTTIKGFGQFRGCEGNFTLCGELSAEAGFSGNVLLRIQDPAGVLRTQEKLPGIQTPTPLDSTATFLQWVGQKGEGPDQENRFSLTPDGPVRGMNIPTQLKRGWIDFVAGEAGGFRASDLRTGEIIGRETGFGRGSQPGATPVGTTISPFQFEGVAHYSFHDGRGRKLGFITTNVLEGRRFDMKLAKAPDEPAYRFGFFGPIVDADGCFQGAEGIFYGSSGSILRLPPAKHIVTHLYQARISDPQGRFRTLNDGRRVERS